MNEKELIRSQTTFDEKRFRKTFTIISILIALIPLTVWFIILLLDNALWYFFEGLLWIFGGSDGESFLCACAGIGIYAVFHIIKKIICKYNKFELVVTDKRVYGNTSFGKQVDLPLDSVSAVAIYRNNGISVATSSGKILFNKIKNRAEIYQIISSLLVNRQRKELSQKESIDNVDEIKKLKELLDMGIITQEEFDKKKKELLGL